MTNRQGYIAYQLREMAKQQTIPSVYTDPQNPDDFIAGYVRAIGPKTCLVESVNPYGRYDGWFAIRLYCVIEVILDSQYAERLVRLLDINREQPLGLPDPDLDWAEADGVVLLLHHAHMRCRAVTCWTETDAFTGFIEQLDDLYATMTLLDFMGQPCGEQRLKLLEVELASLASEEERMYEKLHATP